MSSYAEGQYELAKVDMLRRRLESRLAESGAAPNSVAHNHARYLAALAGRIHDHDPSLSDDYEALKADLELSRIAQWLLERPSTPAPEDAPEDASGETRVPDARDEARQLLQERNEMLAALAAVGIEWSESGWGFHGVISDLGCNLSDALRLYRAATGEVVGTATLYGGGKDGTSIGPGPDDELPELDYRESYRVDLVLRRDKEGV